MNVLAHEILAPPRWRLGEWASRAWRRMGWRHVLLALLLELLRDAIHPLGGVLFPPTQLPGWDPVVPLLSGDWAIGGLPIVYCALVADEAFDDGVPPVLAYGLAVIAMAIVVPVARRLVVPALHSMGGAGQFPGFDEGTAQLVWWSLAILYECGFGLSIYAYWRVTQRAMRRAQAAQTERVRSEQRVQTARLLALQSRVEPQLLFDALGRIGELHDREPQAADALLADMIALLRSMQPGQRVDNSTVEREFTLVEAWLRVTRSTGHEGVRVQLHIPPDVRPVGIAPMLVLPMLRAIAASHGAARGEWLLRAQASGHRLLISLQPTAQGDADTSSSLSNADLSPLRERLAQLFGKTGYLAVSTQPPAVTLDLPLMGEDSHDDRTDR